MLSKVAAQVWFVWRRPTVKVIAPKRDSAAGREAGVLPLETPAHLQSLFYFHASS